MKLLVDINVVLDAVLIRHPWARESIPLLGSIGRREAEGYVASHTVTTIHYLAARAQNAKAAVTVISDLLSVFDVVPIDRADFQHALAMRLADFEDAVQAVAALKIGADYVVTRDSRGYRGAPVSPRSPGEVLALL